MVTGIPVVDAVLAVGSLIVPPAVDFIKKKFLKTGTDTPEATMSTLATTKPEVLPEYVKASKELILAQVEFFKRDISGIPSQWVVDLRAVIRPIGTLGAGCVLGLIIMMSMTGYSVPPEMQETLAGVRYSCEVIVSSWFGDRLTSSR